MKGLTQEQIGIIAILSLFIGLILSLALEALARQVRKWWNAPDIIKRDPYTPGAFLKRADHEDLF